jgi:hypothetical protein
MTVAARTLPDVNSETYPYELVQSLLDQTANFSLFAVPEPGYAEGANLSPANPGDFFGLNGGYGVAIGCSLHRFEATLGMAGGQHGLTVQQAVGEQEGRLRCRWMFGPEDLPWAPGGEPPPAIFDPWSPQRFAMTDAVFTFGDGEHGFRAYGVGRTFPSVVGGRPRILAGAVGNLTEGFGRFHGLEATFVMTGTLTKDPGFLGNITCRVVDPGSRLRGGEISSQSPISDPDPDSTFLVLRGEKKDSTVRTTYGPPPDAERVSLVTPSQMRAVRLRFRGHGSGGPRAETRIHEVVGSMQADVAFNLLAPPGTAQRPVPFTTQELYTFVDGRGEILGTVTAGVVEGISFNLKFPAAPGQPGVRFAGFGPIQGGTGIFAGARGLLTVNSLIGISPHALSLLHVLYLVDSEGGLRSGGRPARKRKEDADTEVLPKSDPFYPLWQHKEEYTQTYRRWREGFQRCSRTIADAIAETYNSLLDMGDFPGLRIDAGTLAAIFARGAGPFDPVAFDRYLGRAAGTFRTYELGTRREMDSSVLYSAWGRENLRFRDGRIGKKILGSFARYYDPNDLPDLSDGKVDIIFNSHRPDVGLTSWVEIYQGHRQQRTSFAYKLPGVHEILWFVKDVSMHGQPIHNNVFMASHEWKGTLRGKTCYFMVGIFFDIDFDACTIQLSGDRFWRALYEEEG